MQWNDQWRMAFFSSQNKRSQLLLYECSFISTRFKYLFLYSYMLNLYLKFKNYLMNTYYISIYHWLKISKIPSWILSSLLWKNYFYTQSKNLLYTFQLQCTVIRTKNIKTHIEFRQQDCWMLIIYYVFENLFFDIFPMLLQLSILYSNILINDNELPTYVIRCFMLTTS